MDYEKEYLEVSQLMMQHCKENPGLDLLNDGMYNYLLGKQSILRELLQEKLSPKDFYELDFSR